MSPVIGRCSSLRRELRGPAANCAVRGDADEVATLERPVVLRAGELVAVAGLRQLDAGQDVGRRRRPQRVDVEAGAVADATGARAAVAEVQRQRVGGLARCDPHRNAQRAAALLQLDDVAADRARGARPCRARSARRCPTSAWSATSAAPAARRCWRSGRRRTLGSGRNTTSRPCCRRLASRRGRRQRGLRRERVFGMRPSCSQRRHARSNRRRAGAGVKVAGPVARRACSRTPPRRCAGAAGGAARRRRCAAGPAPRLRRRGRAGAAPVAARRSSSARGRGRSRALAVAERREHLVRRLAAVERRDQRLHDASPSRRRRARRSRPRGSALRECASGTAPRSRLRTGRGARGARPSPCASANFRSAGARIDRVAAEDQQELHGAGVHLADQLAQRRRADRSGALPPSACRRPSRRRCRAPRSSRAPARARPPAGRRRRSRGCARGPPAGP